MISYRWVADRCQNRSAVTETAGRARDQGSGCRVDDSVSSASLEMGIGDQEFGIQDEGLKSRVTGSGGGVGLFVFSFITLGLELSDTKAYEP